MPTHEYIRKRNFKKTPEPNKKDNVSNRKLKKSNLENRMFVVQEHHASHLHYDFRLELNGVLKSWAVPKGPSTDPQVKRLAVQVEDHPLAYGSFAGTIPKGNYGAGEVVIWDTGIWKPLGSPRAGLKKGHLEFELQGEKLHGKWMLVRTQKTSGKKEQWLLIKRSDDERNSKRQKMPKLISPELALLAEDPPQGNDWVHETKFDGYRTQAHLTNGSVKLYSRSGLNWTGKYSQIKESLEGIRIGNAILDGEVVWVEESGKTDFQKLQNSFKTKNTTRVVYYVFDLLFLDGQDLRTKPLLERKKLLKLLLKGIGGSKVRFSNHVVGRGKDFLRVSCQHDLEGIISKNIHSTYVSARTNDWIKSKCFNSQEFVVGGFSEGEGIREPLGALLVGVFEKDKLRYVGRVGTGFTQKTLQDLLKKLRKKEIEKSPFRLNSPKEKNLHWVQPNMVIDVSFANWTGDKILRHAVFQGLRMDKKASEVGFEKIKSIKELGLFKKIKKATHPSARIRVLEAPKFSITNPDKIIYKKEKIRKKDLANYYEIITPLILPYLKGRPLNLLRCPEQSGKKCFFQKHVMGKAAAHLYPVEIKESTSYKTYYTVENAEGLGDLVQMRAFEIHIWGSTVEQLEYPDQIVMDFDPSPGISWKQIIQAALDLKKILDKLKLKSFVKLSGGKGLHVHIPIEPIYGWDQIKSFAKALAQAMEQNNDLYTVEISKKKRVGKIFVDYLRNGRGATAVAPYSVRSRELSSVAMPVAWSELRSIDSSTFFDLKKAQTHLKKRKQDPWKNYLRLRQNISILKKEF